MSTCFYLFGQHRDFIVDNNQRMRKTIEDFIKSSKNPRLVIKKPFEAAAERTVTWNDAGKPD